MKREILMADCTMKSTLRALLANDGTSIVKSDEAYIGRVLDHAFDVDDLLKIQGSIKYVGVTASFRDVIDYFHVPEGQTPPGFRIEYVYIGKGLLAVDLVRDISYGKNGEHMIHMNT